jgi:hypothetical protein
VVLAHLGAGSAVKSGSSARARLTLTTPLRDFQRWMSATKSPGSSARSTCSRKVILGWTAVTTTGAYTSSPPRSTTPRARPPATSTRSTLASVRTAAPSPSAERRIASATAPMPPSGKPQLPRWPSPTSPMEWWAIT